MFQKKKKTKLNIYSYELMDLNLFDEFQSITIIIIYIQIVSSLPVRVSSSWFLNFFWNDHNNW